MSAPAPQAYPGVPNYIDALLDQSTNEFWNNGNGQGVTLSFNFPSYYRPGIDQPNYFFSAQEMAYVRQALALWSDVANVNFVEVSAGGIARFLVLRLDRIDQLKQVFGFKFSGGRQQAHAPRILRRATIGDLSAHLNRAARRSAELQRSGR